MDFDIPNSTFDNIHFVKEVGSYFSSILSTNYVVFETGQFFRLKRMHHIAPSLFDFAAMQSSLAATKVIMHKSHGGVSLVEQDIIEYISWPI